MSGASTSSKNIAFPLSLAGGVLILLGGAINIMWMGSMSCCQNKGMMAIMQEMMGNPSVGMMTMMMTGFFATSLVAGSIVLVGAIMLARRPEEGYTWGAVIVIFSSVSILGMSGFLIGAVLGIVGGALALAGR